MSMKKWAKREIEIAVARERVADGTKEDEFSYGGACYESAFKAFKSLCKDGHSGMSIGFTKHILNRLIDGKPLTPIEDVEENWDDVSHFGPDVKYKKYQCNRMYSLFKDVYDDGAIIYDDIDRCYCRDINTGSTYKFGLVRDILNELYPITMPYMPEEEPYVFDTEELKLQDTPGDFDTFVIHYIHRPDGKIVAFHRYYTEDDNGKMVQITEEEYESLVNNYIQRGLKEDTTDEKPDFLKDSIYAPCTCVDCPYLLK